MHVAKEAVPVKLEVPGATVRQLEVSDDLVVEVDRFARVVLDPWTRDQINFQEPTTDQTDATALERLVAFTGRTP